jgi:hypothetical protein
MTHIAFAQQASISALATPLEKKVKAKAESKT